MFKGYKKLLENAADMEEQLSSTEAIERAPKVYDELKTNHMNTLVLVKKSKYRGKH